MYKERNSTGQKEKGNDILKYEKKKNFHLPTKFYIL